MFAVVIALVLLAIAVGAICLILRNMGEEGVEIAAPGSCKSGRCGVRCTPAADERHEAMEEEADEGVTPRSSR
jgi:hypothetical protein